VIYLSGTSIPNADVIALSTESRDLDGTAAAQAVRAALIGIAGGLQESNRTDTRTCPGLDLLQAPWSWSETD
jgi:hypothetical protein